MIYKLINLLFPKNNKIQQEIKSKELEERDKNEEKDKKETENEIVNARNKADIINTICDINTLSDIQMENMKKQSKDSLLDIILCFNNNQKCVLDLFSQDCQCYEIRVINDEKQP
jgi:hypothetical protein